MTSPTQIDNVQPDGILMTGKILIAHSSAEKAAALAKHLTCEGFEVFTADSIATARDQLHRQPDLLLLDMQLAENQCEQIPGLAAELELAEVFCLRLCASPSDAPQARQLVPFASGSVSPPAEMEQILEYLAVTRRIRQAETERNQAQERLMLHQMEVAEGLRSAAQIQHALLPAAQLDSDAFSFAWRFIPCETVGGDLLNLLALSEDIVRVYLLDVSGHGVSSAMVTVSVFQSLSDRTSQLVKQTLEHAPFYRLAAPAEVVDALDRVYPFERFDKFFTIVYLLLDKTTGRISYCNGGHPPPILLRASGEVERLECGGPLVGLGGVLPYEEGEVLMAPGDRLYLYSDGISEYAAPTGEMYGEQRLLDFFSRYRQLSLDETASAFMTELLAFGEGAAPADDVSLFCIQFNRPSTEMEA